jgi:hypothetical protein
MKVGRWCRRSWSSLTLADKAQDRTPSGSVSDGDDVAWLWNFWVPAVGAVRLMRGREFAAVHEHLNMSRRRGNTDYFGDSVGLIGYTEVK